jgi:hypothetical protein
MASIEAARAAIVIAAAQMTARGVDTTALAQPILDLQRALAELSELDREVASAQALKN